MTISIEIAFGGLSPTALEASTCIPKPVNGNPLNIFLNPLGPIAKALYIIYPCPKKKVCCTQYKSMQSKKCKMIWEKIAHTWAGGIIVLVQLREGEED